MLIAETETNHSKIAMDRDGNLLISAPEVLAALAAKSPTGEDVTQLRFPIPVSINVLPAV